MRDERTAGMEYLLREISIVLSNRQGSVTIGEDIYRPWLASINSLGVWDAGYVINQRVDHPDEFSEAKKQNEADLKKWYETLDIEMREATEKLLRGY